MRCILTFILLACAMIWYGRLTVLIMKKMIKKIIKLVAVCVVIISCIAIYTYQYILYDKPKSINKVYNGIKFSINDMEVSENANIKIVGIYTRTHGSQSRFNGTISFEDVILNYDDELTGSVRKNVSIASINMGVERSFTINKNSMFRIYFDKEMTQVCIEFGDKKGSTGTFICAPCSTVKDAIRILNTIFRTA